MTNWLQWVVVLGVAYIVVTKTNLIQNFESGISKLGAGGGGGQTAQAQPSAPSAPSAPATSAAPAASSSSNAPAAANPTIPTVVKAPTNARNRVPTKAVAPRNNTPATPAATAAGGALTTGSGTTLASTLTNAQMIAMGISSAGCPAGGASSGGKHCYTLPGRHHCCPGKPSPPGSPSNAAGQSKCDCDA